MKKTMWKFCVDFTDEDGDEDYDEVEVQADTEEVARQKAVDEVHARWDVDTIDEVELLDNW